MQGHWNCGAQRTLQKQSYIAAQGTDRYLPLYPDSHFFPKGRRQWPDECKPECERPFCQGTKIKENGQCSAGFTPSSDSRPIQIAECIAHGAADGDEAGNVFSSSGTVILQEYATFA